MATSGSVIGGLIGASVKRVEDPRFLTGQGHYVDDMKLPGMAYAAFLRSAYAHARIAVDASEARALPGVYAVFTAADLAGVINPITGDTSMPGTKALPHTALASDKVRFVGDLIAMVVAESRYVAEDAADLIQVDYDPLPPVPSIAVALDPASAPLYEEAGDNIAYHDTFNYGDIDAAFSKADRVISETFHQHRYINVPMETRGGLAAYDTASGELTYYAATQSPHAMRFFLGTLLNLPGHRIRVIASDVGGAFGLKFGVYREDLLVAAAAMKTGLPVKWIEDRRENLTAGGHAREEDVTVEAAVENDGTILGVKVKMVLDAGAYEVTPLNPALFTVIVRMVLPGPYRFQHYSFDATVVTTNKAPYVAYRGPWAVETWVREGLADIIARELRLDPVEVRRKNIITQEEQPFKGALGFTLERVSARETLERAVELANIPAFREEQKHLRAQGRLVGFGLATFIEPAPGGAEYMAAMGVGGKEMATVRIEPSGYVTAFTAQAPHGQSHETTLAQVVASELGVPFENVKVVHGDTQTAPFSLIGTGGSRAATMASGAALFATREVKKQVLQIAGGMLEASPDDLELANNIISVRGVPQKAIPLAQVAMLVYLAPGHLPPGSPSELVGTYAYDGGEGGWSQATHCCWVEVDPQTGKVDITRYLVVEDCGTMINPAVVEGQVRGGTAQGIGGVLYEHAVYDDNAQFLTSTFMDYLVPTATEIPPIEIDHLETPPISPVNFRGVGEGGAICAPPAIINAVSDALDVKITQQPLTPTRILELIGAIPPIP
jgi:aerobic carbon-monoxide dehydrogenase large subunit